MLSFKNCLLPNSDPLRRHAQVFAQTTRRFSLQPQGSRFDSCQEHSQTLNDTGLPIVEVNFASPGAGQAVDLHGFGCRHLSGRAQALMHDRLGGASRDARRPRQKPGAVRRADGPALTLGDQTPKPAGPPAVSPEIGT
jgi:hypothetical protein